MHTRLAIAMVALPMFAAACFTGPASPSPSPGRTTVSGVITGYTTGPYGEMNGFTLDSGATVHIPAHTGAQLLPLIPSGEAVTVTGKLQDRGRLIEASIVTNLTTDRTVDLEAIAPAVGGPPGTVAPRQPLPPSS